MKKYILATILLGVISINSHSQILISLLLGDKLNSDKIEFGIDGGLNYSTLSGIDAGRFSSNYNIGFYFDFKLDNPAWMLHTGLQVKSNVGASEIPYYTLGNEHLDELLEGTSYRKDISYFYVPITMKYRFLTLFNVEAGLQAGLRHSASDIYTYSPAEGGKVTYRISVKDQIKRLDVGLLVGLGSKLSKENKSMQCGVKYYYGLVDIMKNNTGAGVYNSAVYLYCSIPIGVKKAERAKAEKLNLQSML